MKCETWIVKVKCEHKYYFLKYFFTFCRIVFLYCSFYFHSLILTFARLFTFPSFLFPLPIPSFYPPVLFPSLFLLSFLLFNLLKILLTYVNNLPFLPFLLIIFYYIWLLCKSFVTIFSSFWFHHSHLYSSLFVFIHHSLRPHFVII